MQRLSGDERGQRSPGAVRPAHRARRPRGAGPGRSRDDDDHLGAGHHRVDESGQVPPQTPPGACDNDVGTVPACSIAAPPGPFCESFADTKASCKSYKTALRNAVAAKAVACLNATSGTQDACDYTKSESCATEAIRTACVQPSTFNACSPVVRSARATRGASSPWRTARRSSPR